MNRSRTVRRYSWPRLIRGRHDGPRQHVVEQRRQGRGGAAAGELAGKQVSPGQPAVMVLQSGFGRGRDRLELKGEAASLVEWPAPFPRNSFEPLMQAWQV